MTQADDDAGVRSRLRERVIRERGYIGPFQESMLALDPKWLERYLAFVNAPNANGRISFRLTQLIYIAIDAAPSHLYPKGIATHLKLARDHGATAAQLAETLEIAVSLTAMTVEIGFPILAEEAARAGLPVAQASDEIVASLREVYKVWRGNEPPAWLMDAARFAPGCVQAMLELMAYPWTGGSLPPKERALIALACHASPAVVSPEGVRRHVREAIAHGATVEEMAEVMCLASGIGIHAISVGGPLLAELPSATA